jgi:N-acetylneuraminate synthase
MVYSREFLDSPRESPWGKTQRDQKRALEFGRREYALIDAHCKARGVAWSASAWDIDSQRFIRSFDVPFNKVASAMLGNTPLLREIAAERRKTFISTGMATLDELDSVVGLFYRHGCPIELLHCNSTYPMREEDANLLCIPMLKARYRCNVGYSGHETSLTKVCVAAVALGATSIERHITMDREMYGSDQAVSIEAGFLRGFVTTMRSVPQMLGTGAKELSAAELALRQKLRVEVPDEEKFRVWQTS